MTEPTGATPYERLGGDAAVRALVDRFYDLMDLEPQYTELRQTHGNDLGHARDKLYWFLSGWLGGPDHYLERFGHPRRRARHLPFASGARAAVAVSMPTPVSAIDSRTYGPGSVSGSLAASRWPIRTLDVVMVRRPPLGIASRALIARFTSTCSSCPGSMKTG